MLTLCSVGLAGSLSRREGDDLRALYAQATPHDAVTRLQREIDSDQVRLAYDEARGYLPAVLRALRIPVSSQVLVFSKTSIQKELISPEAPRALYFNDQAYVGYVPGSKSLEVAALDPQWGPVYYVLLQRPKDKPVFFRTVDACLECHAPRTSPFLPQNLMRSVYAGPDGTPYPEAKSYVTTDASPLPERWGGWYVTGRHGSQRHMGNAFATLQGHEVSLDREQGANRTTLRGLVDTAPFLTPHSDLVALMVLAHQTHLQNVIIQAHYATDRALRAQEAVAHNVGSAKPALTEETLGAIRSACEPLVQALLFAGEAPLKAPVSGTSGFTAQFAAQGPRDRRQRTLREPDLDRRLFRYPCSFTIYSEAFDALPDPAKDYIYGRLWEILSGRDRSEPFATLSAADRKAIREILLDTKPAFAAHRPRR